MQAQHVARKPYPMRWFITFRDLLFHNRQSLVCIAGATISITMFIAMTACSGRAATSKWCHV
jgi:hypothetical protein